MSFRNHHIIQKQSIEINFDSMEDSFGLQNEIAEVFYAKLQPRMEELFDKMFGKSSVTSIDRLEIDCGVVSEANWEQEFTDQAIRRLKEELIQLCEQEKDAKHVKETAATDAFFFYLENGFMPWNSRFNTIAELEELLEINEKLVNRVKTIISQKPKAPDRLAWQFSRNFTARIIAEITRKSADSLNEIYALLDDLNLLQTETYNHSHIDKQIVDSAILYLFASDHNKDKVIQFFTFLLSKVEQNAALSDEIKAIITTRGRNKNNGNNLKKKIKPSQEFGNSETEETKKVADQPFGKSIQEPELQNNEIYINNAGLILLHPFLQSFFENIELTKGNKWINSKSQQSAVLALEFLVSGSDKFQEFDLVLNKIVCGLDPDEIVATGIQLTTEIQSECEALLQEVILYWSVLKNTRIDGLRETFLRRSGKLSKVDNGWMLQVEHKSVDILLNQLPWGIGIVKLPWMSEMLFVEWT